WPRPGLTPRRGPTEGPRPPRARGPEPRSRRSPSRARRPPDVPNRSNRQTAPIPYWRITYDEPDRQGGRGLRQPPGRDHRRPRGNAPRRQAVQDRRREPLGPFPRILLHVLDGIPRRRTAPAGTPGLSPQPRRHPPDPGGRGGGPEQR